MDFRRKTLVVAPDGEMCEATTPSVKQSRASQWRARASRRLGASVDMVPVFYLKFFEHPSFGQVAYEIYPSEWKVHSYEISIIIMYCWYMFLMAVATDLTHVTILI